MDRSLKDLQPWEYLMKQVVWMQPGELRNKRMPNGKEKWWIWNCVFRIWMNIEVLLFSII